MSQRGRRKHIPQRTCIACRMVRPKRELIRIVHTPEGQVVIDERGKRNGRGAYLCAQAVCWDAALLKKRLGAALRTTLEDTDVAMLQAYARSLPERLESAEQALDGSLAGEEKGI